MFDTFCSDKIFLGLSGWSIRGHGRYEEKKIKGVVKG
jgi:hypothetical protein